MTWLYNITTGLLTNDLDASIEEIGYSGTGEGRDNASMTSVPNVGPIPAGEYDIGKAHDELGTLGPCVMDLTPLPGTNVFGRTDFRIHGNNAANDASHGCVILGPATRHLIAASDDRTLSVSA